MVQTTITYKNPNVQPPVYLAGSFTHPAWELREMVWTTNEAGEHIFTSEVDVESGKDHQYKFKLGHGDDWDLNADRPTTNDEHGNRNNLLVVKPERRRSEPRSPVAPKSLPAKPVLSPPLTFDNVDPFASANERNKQADNHVNIEGVVRSEGEPAEPATPLFSHESLGAYDFGVVDDGFDHSISPRTTRASLATSGAFAPDSEKLDPDDPTLEMFPSDRTSVVDTLRRISTSMGETPVNLHGNPLSSSNTSRKASVESISESLPSLESLSPTSSRKRDSRMSHGSMGRTKSAVSLHSITEESSAAAVPQVAATEAANKTLQKEGQPAAGRALDLASDEDDGPQMKSSKVNPSVSFNQGHHAQEFSNEGAEMASKTDRTSVLRTSRASDVGGSAGYPESHESKWLLGGALVIVASMGITWWKTRGS